jgi:hypothetical protein
MHKRMLLSSSCVSAFVLIFPATSFGQLSQFQLEAMLNGHNQARCEVDPPAATMPAMIWDDQLAAVAEAHANAGVFQHNPNRQADYVAAGGPPGVPVGENIAAGNLSPTQVVGLWVQERINYDHATNLCAQGQQCGHYTQVVWADTIRVGCGQGLRQQHRLLGLQLCAGRQLLWPAAVRGRRRCQRRLFGRRAAAGQWRANGERRTRSERDRGLDRDP